MPNSVEEKGMGIVLNEANDASFLRLEGSIDISVATELRAALLGAIAAGKAIRVSAEAASEFDVTAFQLLWAAGREAKRSGMQIMLDGQMPETVRNGLSVMNLDACGLFA
jgi:ABC-type transporter Mla MlaB component